MQEIDSTPRATPLPEVVVAGLGLVVVDQLAIVETYPTVDSKVFSLEHSIQIGGPVPTALAQLRRFGIKSRFLGSWADDAFGDTVEAHLRGEQIGFEKARCRTAASTGFAHVWIESRTGRRTIVSSRPYGTPAVAAAGDFGRESDVLHLDGWGGEAAVAAARATAERGGLVTLDAGSVKPATERLRPYARVLNAPMRFIRAYCGTGDAALGAKALLSGGAQIVTVTDGEEGAGIYTPEVSVWLPAFRVQAVDTCGAGDVFCGGLIYACLAKLEPVTALQFAMATAAIKVSRRGNREALATDQEILEFLQSVG